VNDDTRFRPATPARSVFDRRAALVAGGSIALALVVMLLPGETSLWLDEAVSVAIARAPWDDFWAIVSEREANMSLYFGALKVWMVAGDAEPWLRALSVSASLGTIAVTYLLGTRIVGKGVGAAAALVVAVNGLFLSEATQIRGYGLAALLVVSSSYFFVRALQDASRGAWLAYALTAGLALYVHVFAGLVILGQLASLAWRRERPDVPWRRVAGALLGIAVIAAPIVAFALLKGGQIGWIGEPTLSKTIGTFVVVAGGLAGGRARAAPDQALGLVLTAVYALGFALALVELRARAATDGEREGTWGRGFLLATTAGPVVLAFAVSIAAQPIFYYKYFAVIVPMLAILVAAGLTYVTRRGFSIALFAILSIVSLAAIGRCYDDCNREDWVRATRYVESAAGPGDAVVFYAPYVRTPFDYYVRDLEADVVYPEVPYTAQSYEETVEEPDRALVADLADDYETVWLVSSHANVDGDVPGGRLVSWLTDSYGSAREASFEGVRIFEFGE
jgi:mannosyltransferase